MRKLTTGDLFTVVGMLRKVVGVAGGLKGLDRLISSRAVRGKGGGETDPAAIKDVVVELITNLYDNVRDDMTQWMASLLEVDAAQFMALPIDAVPNLIEDLTESKEARDFFSKALALSKKIETSAGRFRRGGKA